MAVRKRHVAAVLCVAIAGLMFWDQQASRPGDGVAGTPDLHQFYTRINNQDLRDEVRAFLASELAGSSRDQVVQSMRGAGWNCTIQADFRLAEPHAICLLRHPGLWFPLRGKSFWRAVFLFGDDDRLRRVAEVLIVADYS